MGSGAGSGGSLNHFFDNTGTPLLNSFRFNFTNGDHRLLRIAAFPLAPAQQAEEITYADQNGDDPFTYRTAHEMADPTGIVTGSFHGNCGGGSCPPAPISRPAGNVTFVLTGFRFEFTNGEHKLDQIAVSESNGRLSTVFKDLNGDDPYTYVPTTRLSQASEAANVVHQSGSQSFPTNVGAIVLRGFSIDNLGSGNAGDNNIRDLGVITNGGTVTAIYSDNNPQDSADWRYTVQYATVS